MERELHRVTEEELPILFDWLTKYLPHSFTIWGTLNNELKGKWSGSTYYTLGWPEILAVGQGEVNQETSPCPRYLSSLPTPSVYSPNLDHAEQLLNVPGYIDWTKPIAFTGVSHEVGDVIHKISQAKGAKTSRRYVTVAVRAGPGDIQPLPIPEGYEARQLGPEHAEYVASTWRFRRPFAEEWVEALIRRFPSYGIFDKNGEPIAVEVTSEMGSASLLHTREEARGLGLGKCVASLLAHQLVEENGSVMATIVIDNEPSLRVHEKIGYQPVCKLDWILHAMDEMKVDEKGSY